MSDAAEGKTELVTGPDQILPYFLKPQPENRMGVELEISFLARTPDGGTRPINNAENKELQHILANPAAYGFSFAPVGTSEEAGTFTLEVKTGAVNFDSIETIITDLEHQLAAVKVVAAHKGYLVSSFAQVSQPDVDTLLSENVIDRPRARAFMDTFCANGLKDYCRNFLLNTSAQISVSFADPADLHRAALRLLALTAPLSTVHDNSSGTLEGKPDPKQTGLRLREGLAAGGRGGLLVDVFAAAHDTESLVRGYIEHALSRDILALYDADGKNLAPVSQDERRSFNDLIAENAGLNSFTNFDLVFGMIWPHLKLAFIKKPVTREGKTTLEITGGRLEVRACDTGPFQHVTFPLVVAALCCDKNLAAKTDALLKKYGLDLDDPRALRRYLQPSVDAALDYRDEFGAGKVTDFLAEFGKLIKDAYADKPALAERLTPFLKICEDRKIPGREPREGPVLASSPAPRWRAGGA